MQAQYFERSKQSPIYSIMKILTKANQTLFT